MYTHKHNHTVKEELTHKHTHTQTDTRKTQNWMIKETSPSEFPKHKFLKALQFLLSSNPENLLAKKMIKKLFVQQFQAISHRTSTLTNPKFN